MRAQGRGGAFVSELNWNGRRPTANEQQSIDAAVAPYSVPRSVGLSCEGDQHRVVLEFWDAHEGVRRLAIRMDAEGFRLEPPPSDGAVPE